MVRRQPKAVNLKIGDVTLCKLRGYCEWPCFVTSLDNNMIEVEFFGDHTSYKAKIDKFFDIQESFDVILNNLQRLKSPLYKKSIKEMEIVLGIPPESSML